MKVVDCYPFNNGIAALEQHDADALNAIKGIIEGVDVSDCKDKESKERGKGLLYSPIKMNVRFKEAFRQNEWTIAPRIPARYESLEALTESANAAIAAIHARLSAGPLTPKQVRETIKEETDALDRDSVKLYSADTVFKRLVKDGLIVADDEAARRKRFTLTGSATEADLANVITPDFIGFREMDAVKNRVGVEVQFGKYAFMVYNVCAKMTIFHKHDLIDYGVEIVPVKSLQREMSTGVAFYEQFVWDLKERGPSDIDIPVVVVGIGL